MATAEDRALVVAAFDGCTFPSGVPNLDEAWLGIYQTLWWYDHGVIHVREANDLRKPVWQRRASVLETYLAAKLGVQSSALPTLFDRMMRLPRWEGMQRNNPIGNGLRVLVSETLARWGDARFTYPEEVSARFWFPGISLPGRSDDPKFDVGIIGSDNLPVAVVSCKWSIRHDRISDPTNESVMYKGAAMQQNRSLRYFVVTNEYSVRRLDKIINQPAVDGLVHVCLAGVAQIEAPSRLMQAARESGRLLDLSEFVAATTTW